MSCLLSNRIHTKKGTIWSIRFRTFPLTRGVFQDIAGLEVFETIQGIKEKIGLTVLLLEQNAEASLNATDDVYIMHEGQIKAEGSPEKIKASSEIGEVYLGIYIKSSMLPYPVLH